MDREKVIRIIDELIFEAQKAPTWKAENALRCLKKELLKEQEAVEPLFVENPYTHLPVSYCPKCREPIDQYITGNPYRKTKYCHYCGQAVKWE